MIITKHAYKRAKQRAGFNKKTTERMATKALEQGDDCAFQNAKGKQYGNFIYVFKDDILITIICTEATIVTYEKGIRKERKCDDG